MEEYNTAIKNIIFRDYLMTGKWSQYDVWWIRQSWSLESRRGGRYFTNNYKHYYKEKWGPCVCTVYTLTQWYTAGAQGGAQYLLNEIKYDEHMQVSKECKKVIPNGALRVMRLQMIFIFFLSIFWIFKFVF